MPMLGTRIKTLIKLSKVLITVIDKQRYFELLKHFKTLYKGILGDINESDIKVYDKIMTEMYKIIVTTNIRE